MMIVGGPFAILLTAEFRVATVALNLRRLQLLPSFFAGVSHVPVFNL